MLSGNIIGDLMESRSLAVVAKIGSAPSRESPERQYQPGPSTHDSSQRLKFLKTMTTIKIKQRLYAPNAAVDEADEEHGDCGHEEIQAVAEIAIISLFGAGKLFDADNEPSEKQQTDQIAR